MTDQPIALVTGGAQGIGLACGRALAADGYRVMLVDVKDSVTAAATSIGGRGFVCDVADTDALLALFDRIEAEEGPVAALVNNAGIAKPGDFLSYDLADFDAVIGLNLRAVFAATQRAAKGMIAANIKGAIVNMSSINAVVAIPAIPAYCASKGGGAAIDQGILAGAGPAWYSRQCGRTRLHRYRDDGRRERQPRGLGARALAHTHWPGRQRR